MKKFLLIMILAVVSTASGYAQFEQGKKYLGLSFSGLELSYSDVEDLNLGLQAKAGYFCMDNWMLSAEVKYNHDGSEDASDYVSAAAGTRYYLVSNGLYFGANVNFIHAFHNYNDVRPGVELGYSFFLNGRLTIEPSLYYEQSFKNHSDYSKCGLKIGLGYYF